LQPLGLYDPVQLDHLYRALDFLLARSDERKREVFLKVADLFRLDGATSDITRRLTRLIRHLKCRTLLRSGLAVIVEAGGSAARIRLVFSARQIFPRT
jgi:hypothetical protein